MRFDLRAGLLKRPARFSPAALCLAVAAFAGAAAPAAAQYAPGAVQAAVRSADAPSRDVRNFYAARGHQPLWINGFGLRPEAGLVLRMVETADLDGLDPDDYRPRQLAEAMDRAMSGSPRALARAEMLLSRSFAEYARDLRRPRDIGMIYADKELAPKPPSARELLEQASSARSLEDYLSDMGWMNPVYGELRQALAGQRFSRDRFITLPSGPMLRPGATGERVRMLRYRLGLNPDGDYDAPLVRAVRDFQGAYGLPQDGVAGARTLAALNTGSPQQEELLRVNLERARALPAPGRGRFVLVDAAAARLWLYEDGKVQDTMRVVVGKPSEPTPMMAGLIRYATINPYWNIPPDLVKDRVAPEVLSKGISYLKGKRYEVLSDWTANARTVDPTTVDWRAVASGKKELRVRQLPGSGNGMGKVKFMFPNELGVYLHDTPEKKLLREEERLFSAGCVRLEDAPRLARWLFGRQIIGKSDQPEHNVSLPEPVPVYLTYLTAAPENGRIAFRPDVYNRDAMQMARLGSRSYARR